MKQQKPCVFMVYIRLWELQRHCFKRGKKKWAKALGLKMQEMRIDFPQLKEL